MANNDEQWMPYWIILVDNDEPMMVDNHGIYQFMIMVDNDNMDTMMIDN